MKKNVLILALLPLAFSVFAQEKTVIQEEVTQTKVDTATTVKKEPESGSSVIFNGSPYDFIFSWKNKKKAQASHWTGLGFSFSSLKSSEEVDLDLGHSYSLVLNIVDYIIPFNQNWLMATGLGVEWGRYRIRGNKSLQSVDGQTHFLPDREGREYRDSKFLIRYATIPLILEYQTKFNSKQTFFIYGGVEGLVKLYSKSQVEIKTPDGIRNEVYKDLSLLPLNFRFTGRIGFEQVSLVGYYQPVSMFEKGKGPDVYPYGLGLMLNF